MTKSILRKKAGVLLSAAVVMMLGLSTLSAQTAGKISGKITDQDTGEPLVGCNVIIVGTGMGASTDMDGSFFIINVPPRKFDVEASILGYQKVVQRDVIVNSGRTTVVNFKLKTSALLQAEVVIQATRPDVEVEKTSTSMITRLDEVQQLPAMHSASDALKLSSEVDNDHFRGGRTDEVLYTLQGIASVNPYDNSNVLNPIMSAIEEVEVVTSGMGAQYGSAQSGVVNISMKEGKTDKWRSFADIRIRVPGKKHFGSSPWDSSVNPYLKELDNPANYNLWVTDGLIPAKYGAPGNVGDGYLRLLNDTVMCAKIAYALQQQLLNNQNRSYGNKPDYSAEFAFGGPVNESMRTFLAMNTNVSWPILATEHPDENYQLSGNLVNDLGRGATFRLSTVFSQNNTNTINANSNSAYDGFLYNMLTGTQYRQRQNVLVGLRFTKALDQSTFYEIKLSGLATRDQIGSRNCLPDSIQAGTGYNVYWADRPSSSVEGYANTVQSNFRDDKNQTISFDGSITSQIAKAHLINAGIQANMFLVDVNERSGGSYVGGWTTTTNYYARPIEASAYIQDKMEFEGMIANVGLRADGWNMRGSFGNLDSVYVKNHTAPILVRLQPRAGFSFPISTNTVFHVNYGSFVQRAQFQYTSYEQSRGSNLNFVPNPALKPEMTNSYDIGLSQALAEGFTIDVSGYYKNVTDLVRRVEYVISGFNSQGQDYYSYVNYDYADIRGFHVSLTKRKGSLAGSINYTYSVNTGSSSSATATNLVQKYLNNGGVISLTDNSLSMPTQEVLLDFDRTHSLVVNLAYTTDMDFGFAIGDTHPLGDIAIALTSTASSGRPFTYKTSSADPWMNMRSPAEYNTDLKLSKRIKDFFGTTLTAYAEVFNVFDNKTYNYNYLFQASLTADNNSIIQRYLAGSAWPSNDQLLYFSLKSPYTPGMGVDQSFIIYSNQPRSFWVGVSVEF
ncbi:MAG TPA: TonB-dependent receptor [Bacteroidota bacterium]|nr:TonB-dependent receptor [Bacteroidota bacterium]